MRVAIVESPNKVKAIQRYLEAAAPGPWRVVATIGHWRGLPAMNGQSFESVVDMGAGWREQFDLHKPEVARQLASALRGAREVFLATDPDREGEAIAWHVVDFFELRNAKRLLIKEVTKSGVRRALAEATTLDRGLAEAQRTRALLDYWIGMEVSRQLWPFGARSAGRVQSCALRIVVDRERAIGSFRPEPFWTIRAEYGEGFAAEVGQFEEPAEEVLDEADSPDRTLELRPRRFASRAEAEALVAQGSAVPHVVEAFAAKPVVRRPPPPHTTASLLAAGTAAGIRPDSIAASAQRLFERGLITYHRTDSVTLSEEGIADIRRYVADHYPEALPAEPQRHGSSPRSQGAHEAIRPTSMASTPDETEVEGDDRRVYELVWRAAVVSQMASAELERTIVTIAPQGCAWRLLATCMVVKETGFLAVARSTARTEKTLPPLRVGQVLQLRHLGVRESSTKPPVRFSARGLVRYLERRGIGRPSTYAGILTTLLSRGYVREERRQLVPEPLGELAERLVREGFDALTQESFTAVTEKSLDHIAEGRLERTEYLSGFYKGARAMLEVARTRFASLPKPPKSWNGRPPVQRRRARAASSSVARR